jgi:hypothetical protein
LWYELQLDEAYFALAKSSGQSSVTKTGVRVEGFLETEETRKAAHDRTDRNTRAHFPEWKESELGLRRNRSADIPETFDNITKGDQQDIFNYVSEHMTRGYDIISGEQRNKQWMEKVVLGDDKPKAGDCQLWIVGAYHIPGLVLRFQQHGWTVNHQTM